MMAYWDRNQKCLFANEAYREWFGKAREEMIGISMEELLGPLYALNLPYITGVLQGKQQVFERAIPLPDGSIRHSLATYTPDVAGAQVAGFFVHVADITPLKKLEAELKEAKDQAEKLATHDFLTGLPNRALFNERFSQALASAKRHNRMMALMVLDLDDFKVVNDTYGHQAGDDLLTTLAERMSSVVRRSDTIARIGGDEFTVCCVEVESKDAVAALADRLLRSIAVPTVCGGHPVTPSMSLGVAVFPADGDDLENLYFQADLAMYKSKRSGGNEAVFASETQPSHPLP